MPTVLRRRPTSRRVQTPPPHPRSLSPKGGGERISASRFFATRIHGGFSLRPDGQSVLAVVNLSRRPEVWRIDRAHPFPDQLTFTDQRAGYVRWTPDGKSFIFASDHHGNEAWRLFWLPAIGGEPRPLTPEGRGENLPIDFSKDGRFLYYSSNRRELSVFDLCRVEIAGGKSEILYQGNSLTTGESMTSDGRFILGVDVVSNSCQKPFVFDLRTRLLSWTPLPGDGVAKAGSCQPGADPGTMILLTDVGQDHQGMASIRFDGSGFRWLRRGPFEIEELSVTADGRRMAWVENRHGNLQVCTGSTDGSGVRRITGVGGAGNLNFSEDGRTLAFYHGDSKAPAEIVCHDLEKGTRQVLTKTLGGGIPAGALSPSRVLEYRASDGERIEALWYAPRLPVKAPYRTIVWMHGGPEHREENSYKPAFQYFTHLGFAVLAVNFRGSTGRGRRFQRLIYQRWGEECYTDVTAGVDLLVRKGLIDPKRLVVLGGSYGGYMTLVAITREPSRWKAAVDIFGPSNLFTFIESVPEHWRAAVADLVGDPVKDRDQLRLRSPIFHVDKIRTPLYVVQGANDPRVKQKESEQIVAALRKRKRPVDYLLLKDEGHGFSKLENQIRVWESAAAFLEKYVPG